MNYYLNIKEKELNNLDIKVNHALQIGFEIVGGLNIYNNEEYIQTMIIKKENIQCKLLDNGVRMKLLHDCSPNIEHTKMIEILGYTNAYLFVVQINGNVQMMTTQDILDFYTSCFPLENRNIVSHFTEKNLGYCILHSLVVTQNVGEEGYRVTDKSSKIEAVINACQYFQI